jgi:DNA ligase 1
MSTVIPTNFRPLRACSVDHLHLVKLPVLASFKHDGIRCETIISPRSGNKLAASRKLLPIPNNHIRRTIRNSCVPPWVSGELIAGNQYDESESAIMSVEGEPDFNYWLFDYLGFGFSYGFKLRYEALKQLELPSWCRVVEHHLIETQEQLIAFEQQAFDLGYEGIVLRRPDGRYKYGRSTLVDGLCLRYVRYERVDCKVVGFKQKEENTNELETDYLGYAKRSKRKAGMVLQNAISSLEVVTQHATTKLPAGIKFSITVGEHKLQKEIFAQPEKFLGQILVAEFKPYGTKDKPRQPILLRWRKDDKL